MSNHIFDEIQDEREIDRLLNNPEPFTVFHYGLPVPYNEEEFGSRKD